MNIKKILIGAVAGVAMLGAMVVSAFAATPVSNLQPDYDAVGAGGVYSAYYGPPTHDPVSPGSTTVFDERQAGIIKAGQGANPGQGTGPDFLDGWDEGLFGFKPTVTINAFADGILTYDVETEFGVNPVWMTIEIDTGVVNDRDDNTTYQFVPPSNLAGWNTFNAGAGLWQEWNDNSGDVGTNPLISLSQVALDNTGLNVVRTYLRLGMGDTYYNGSTGTTAWVDKTTIGGVTYDFVVSGSTVKVTVDKFVDGSHATAATANSSAFPMVATWNATNIGAGTGNYDLDADGFNANPTPYQAITADMTSGANYTTNEVTGGSVVGASCTDGKPFALVGYSTGDTSAQAAAAAPTATIPAFTGLTSDKFVIVWDKTCPSLTGTFRPVRRISDISVGNDLGGTSHQAINFKGSTGSAGDSWVDVYDTTPNDSTSATMNIYGSVTLTGDVLMHPFNNRKGAGLLALYNEVATKKGLGLIVYDNGNTDALVLATIDYTTGKVTNLKSVALGSGIAENAWYHATMDVAVSGGNVTVTGKVFKHTTSNNADSAVGAQVGGDLGFTGPLPSGVDATGEVGFVGSAISAVIDTSVTNFTVDGTLIPPGL